MVPDLYVELMDPSFDPPSYQTAGAAGIDLPARFPVTILPRGEAVVETPYKIHIPAGSYGHVLLRSGHGFKHGLDCHSGILDEDYRGQLKVMVFNRRNTPYTIDRGERFGQLVVAPVLRPNIVVVANLEDTVRGEGGFGSTGS